MLEYGTITWWSMFDFESFILSFCLFIQWKKNYQCFYPYFPIPSSKYITAMYYYYPLNMKTTFIPSNLICSCVLTIAFKISNFDLIVYGWSTVLHKLFCSLFIMMSVFHIIQCQWWLHSAIVFKNLLWFVSFICFPF